MTNDRVASSRALDAERMYRTLVEQVPVVVYVAEFGQHGPWRYVSPRIESMLGFSPEEWLANPALWYDQMVPEDREGAMADEALSREMGTPLRSEYRLRTHDGRVVWVRDEAVVVHDGAGRPSFFHGILADITPEKEAEKVAERAEVAEQANRAKDEFLSRMSHELRTPLNAILGFGQLLQTSPLAPADAESVEQILKGGRHLLDLINEVLDIARIESRTLSLSIEPVSVYEVIREAVDLVLPLAAKRGIAVHASGSDPASFVLADRQRLKQAMLNLLANAVKYNHEGGSATVSVEGMADSITIRVRDTGLGIRSEDQERLFSPFDRLGAERTGIEGTGLGLALTKALVEGMGGSIGVESEIGTGSTFWLALRPAEDPNSLEDPAREPSGDRGPIHTILCIEDDPSNLRLIERILANRPGVRLLKAIRGRMGLDLAREHHPDLIVVDVHLPDIPGDHVIRRLRNGPATGRTPVIVTSADATPKQRKRLIAAGATEYLSKPLDVKRFLAVVDEALGNPPIRMGASPPSRVGW
ncbi:MAG TPA: ATP-binding protein [Actinomycetota bacterium]|nr:ATP-binding protein [Actinomycetota bacterium]